ncbi:MAG: AraC family transcriptional regulator [Pseudomonadota bacterium]
MPSLPIPLVSALILGFLLARIWLVDGRRGPLVGLLALCALQGLVISLVQHYGLTAVRPAQAIIASLIPPAAWNAFQSTAVRPPQRRDLVHLLPPALTVLGLLGQPMLLDALIPAFFFAYGGALLWRGSESSDRMPRIRLETGDLPGRIWRMIGAALILSGLSDVLIALVLIAGQPHYQPWIVTIFSSGMLLVIGGLSLSQALVPAHDATAETRAKPLTAEDGQIVARLQTLMAEQRLYLDPDLTLAQLARRMRLPVKQLSGAINRVTGENVSRFINGARIVAAQKALDRGENITNAMLSAGFNTKSNFNREFRRVTGNSPSAWLAERPGSRPANE